MREQSFKIVSLLVVLALALLVAVEAMWSVRTYRNMRNSYEQQICSILEEATWKYATNSMNGDAAINIGNISRFHAFVGEGLRTAGLATDFRVEVLSTTDADDIIIMSMGELPANEDIISVDKRLTPLILRLTVADPHSTILGDMKRMLIMQGLSVFFLVFAFLYLLRTLFRAKEVERIRRDLTHNITHELKTPIAAAYAATEALHTMPNIANDSVVRSEYINISLNELRRLSGMVEEILRTSTEEFTTAELRIEECDVMGVVTEVCSTLDMRYTARDASWSVDIDDGCAVVADAFHLRGIISALIDNAIKYSEGRPMITIRATTRSGYTYLTIEDQGVGIPDDEQKRIFDKFYRVTKGNNYTTSGYGLGLFYVKNIVERHNGSIAVESSPGKGSRFTIKLPRYGW